MKKSGILNRDIATVLARLGHTDTIVIGDCGLPIPNEVPCIDLSLELGTPKFTSVLKAVSADMMIEEMTFASEIKDNNKALYDEISEEYKDIPKNYITHENLKKETGNSQVIIRTGEATPFANVILKSGVIF
ncbi:ribose transport protein RbsD [Virgibacillus subterraneus]|uniref:D-ribose pyranase n=1 Tax=Virgibacillus subterraneus TaxID=621109 RepID=A0A1H9FIM8_9BACI|nr:D-ribose pyranase [Virgibacillus subterraneus]SEQ37762.1 ribose transport protein RbsD [Virgibacillus subterraneus]